MRNISVARHAPNNSRFWLNPRLTTIAALMLIMLLIPLAGCTIVSIEEVEAREQSETFDPVSFVDGVWESQIVPAVEENAVDLPTVLTAIGDDLEAGGDEHGLFVSGAYNFMVNGKGKIANVDTESRNGVATVELEGYAGPTTVILQVGPLIRGNSVRDSVGFIKFGDFKEQTEFGQVSKEINKRVSSDVIGERELASLEGKVVEFDGAFSISTTNQTNIDLSEISIAPVTLTVEE